MTEALDNRGPVWDAAVAWRTRLNDSPDDPAVRDGLLRWLDADAAHAEAYRKVDRIQRLAAFAARGDSLAAGRRRWQWPVAALAASLALALILPPALLRLGADRVTGTGEIDHVQAPDGSVVTLGADSAVAVQVSDVGRKVKLLAGEAYFEVAADRRRPFTVAAGEITVTVTGTAFDVRLGSTMVVIAVREGHVAVSAGQHGETTLAAGEQLTVTRATGAAVLDAVPVSHIAAWRSGQLIVEDATIAEVIERIRPYHGGAIVVTDDALLSKRVSGVYELGKPDSALRAVVQPHGGSVLALTPFLMLVSGR